MGSFDAQTGSGMRACLVLSCVTIWYRVSQWVTLCLAAHASLLFPHWVCVVVCRAHSTCAMSALCPSCTSRLVASGYGPRLSQGPPQKSREAGPALVQRPHTRTYCVLVVLVTTTILCGTMAMLKASWLLLTLTYVLLAPARVVCWPDQP